MAPLRRGSQPSSSVAKRAALLALIVFLTAVVAGAVLALTSADHNGGGSGTWQAAVLSARTFAAQTCPPCPAAAAANLTAGNTTQGAAGADEPANLLCGGPEAVPRVLPALQNATAALHAGVEAAFAQWEGKGFTLEDLLETAWGLQITGAHDTMVWVEVRKGKVVFPRRINGTCTWNCNGWLGPLQASWERAIADGRLRVPEGVPFLWNVFDYPGCPRDAEGRNTCSAPLLSIITATDHADLPVPPFAPGNAPEYEPVFVPWSEKKDVAFFRGTAWCGTHFLNGSATTADGGVAVGSCSRDKLALLTVDHPDLINATLYQKGNYPGQAPLTPGPLASHYHHAKYKYLLQLDGITASRRYAALLATNSLVLKQASKHSEWYYSALQPCVHYLPFWQTSEDDVLDLVRTLQSDSRNELTAQRIAANAQAFAAAWLDEDGRLRYWQMVVDKYVQLYRGSMNATTIAARERIERCAPQAAKHAVEYGEACAKEGKEMCWMTVRPKQQEFLLQLMKEDEAAHPAAAGGGKQAAAAADGGGGAAADGGKGAAAAQAAPT